MSDDEDSVMYKLEYLDGKLDVLMGLVAKCFARLLSPEEVRQLNKDVFDFLKAGALGLAENEEQKQVLQNVTYDRYSQAILEKTVKES